MSKILLNKLNGLGVLDEDNDRDYFIQVYHNFLRSDKYTPYEKLVYMELKSYAGAKSLCFPGQAGIARDLGISRKKVNETIKSLSDKGIILIINQQTKSNRKTVNTYVLPKIDRNNGEFILSSLDKYRELAKQTIVVDGV